MKQLYAIFAVMYCCCQLMAQHYQISYLFKYKEDSTSQNYINHKFILQIEPQKTKFIFENLIEVSKSKKLTINGSYFYSIPMEQQVEKEVGSDDFKNYTVFSSNYYVYKTKDPIQWTILEDTKEEHGYKLQKATTNFGKRNWEVWFIPSIPIPEGPFKFRGLPGLIYEVKDEADNFIYSLAEIKKVDKMIDTSSYFETHFGTKPIDINLKKYHELIINDFKNPYSEYRGMKEGSWSIWLDNDRKVDTIDQLNQYTKEYQENKRRKNNPVELDKVIQFPTK